MTPRAFIVLLVVTAAAAAGAASVIVSRDTGTGIRGEGRLLFPELAGKVNDVRRIEVTRGNGTATLVATEEDGAVQWNLKELHGYPVPLSSVRAVAAGMARVAAVEAKTTMPSKYPRIRVEDPEGKESRSARVELFGEDGEKLADLIVGLQKDSFTGPGQVYVRRPGEARAWLCRGKIDVPVKLEDWVNRAIIEVDLPRVRETTLYVPGEKPLRVYKEKERDQDFIVEGMPEGYELKELFGAEDIARSIQNLYLEEVRPNAEIGIDLTTTPRARYVTFDGLIVEAWMKEVDGKKWVTFRARPNPEPLPADKVDKEQVAKDVAKINSVNKGWAYTISDFETKNLSKTLAGMIQPKPGAEAAPDKKDASN